MVFTRTIYFVIILLFVQGNDMRDRDRERKNTIHTTSIKSGKAKGIIAINVFTHPLLHTKICSIR